VSLLEPPSESSVERQRDELGGHSESRQAPAHDHEENMTRLTMDSLCRGSDLAGNGAMAHGESSHALTVPETLPRELAKGRAILVVRDGGRAVPECGPSGPRPEEEIVILGCTLKRRVEADAKEEIAADQRRLASEDPCPAGPFLRATPPGLARLPVG
jgi:hypothetical protein